MINWQATKQEYELASQIAKRYVALVREVEGHLSRTRESEIQRTTLMDIIAVHINACPLKLQELLTAERFDFSHDVSGIRRYFNRESGKLEDCFLPRYAQLEHMS